MVRCSIPARAAMPRAGCRRSAPSVVPFWKQRRVGCAGDAAPTPTPTPTPLQLLMTESQEPTRMGHLRFARIYTPPEARNRLRVLVDRLWPGGMTHELAQFDLWLKAVAPLRTKSNRKTRFRPNRPGGRSARNSSRLLGRSRPRARARPHRPQPRSIGPDSPGRRCRCD